MSQLLIWAAVGIISGLHQASPKGLCCKVPWPVQESVVHILAAKLCRDRGETTRDVRLSACVQPQVEQLRSFDLGHCLHHDDGARSRTCDYEEMFLRNVAFGDGEDSRLRRKALMAGCEVDPEHVGVLTGRVFRNLNVQSVWFLLERELHLRAEKFY